MGSNQTNRKPQTPDALMKQRDDVMMELHDVTGINSGELSRLTIQDVNLDAGSLLVHGWNGTRTVPLLSSSRDLLRQYIQHFRPAIATCTGEDALFISIYDEKPMSPSHVQRTLNHLRQSAAVAQLRALAQDARRRPAITGLCRGTKGGQS